MAFYVKDYVLEWGPAHLSGPLGLTVGRNTICRHQKNENSKVQGRVQKAVVTRKGHLIFLLS